jgi:ribonuclease HI
MAKVYKVFTDGGVRGNPGIGASAYLVILPDGNRLKGVTGYDKKVTNNEMEYEGIISALTRVVELEPQKDDVVELRSDSLLVVQQINGKYAINHQHLLALAEKVWTQLAVLSDMGVDVDIRHIRRELNTDADLLCTEFLDSITKKKRGG